MMLLSPPGPMMLAQKGFLLDCTPIRKLPADLARWRLSLAEMNVEVDEASLDWFEDDVAEVDEKLTEDMVCGSAPFFSGLVAVRRKLALA